MVALLLEHVRSSERPRGYSGLKVGSEESGGLARRSAPTRSIEFSPLLQTPAIAGPSTQRFMAQTTEPESTRLDETAESKGAEDSPSGCEHTLEGVLGKFEDTQRGLAKGDLDRNANLPDETDLVSSLSQTMLPGRADGFKDGQR